MGLAEEYEKISQSQSKTAAANFIHTEISKWRGTRRPAAARRWLWELLQNALDSAVLNQTQFSLRIKSSPSELIIRHDAGPFELSELVALVEGNTSKYSREVDLAGRFGRGFLVSHVISTEVRVKGLLKDRQKNLHQFRFQLSRNGSMEQIRNNILECAKALNSASPYSEGPMETTFTYQFSPKDEASVAINEGLEQLRIHAPYLFAFLPQLKRIHVEKDSEPVVDYERSTQEPIRDMPDSLEGARTVINTPAGSKSIITLSTRLHRSEEESAAVVTIAFPVRQGGNQEEIVATTTLGVSKVFADLPLYATNELRNPIVINIPKNCDVDPDRAIPDLSKRSTFRAVFSASQLLTAAVRWASAGGLGGVHSLAEIGVPDRSQWEPLQGQFWQEIFQSVLTELVKCRLVATADGHWVRPDEVTFPKADWLGTDSLDRALLLGVHELLELRGDRTPRKEIVEEWNDIILAWKTLEVPIKLTKIGLSDVFHEFARYNSLKDLLNNYAKLKNDEGAVGYVSTAFSHAAFYCQRNRISYPSELQEIKAIPNQNGIFCLAERLSLDGGIDSTLKAIASDLGASLRQRLVHGHLVASEGKHLIAHLCGDREVTTQAAVSEVVSKLEQKAQERLKDPESSKVKDSAVRLLVWLAGHAHATSELTFSSFPLVCSDNELHWASELHDGFIVPAELIPESQVHWLELLPKSIQLAQTYMEVCRKSSTSEDVFRAFLTNKGIASDSLIYARFVEVDSETATALQLTPADGAGHKLEGFQVMDVPGLTRLLSETAGAGSGATGSTQVIRVLEFILSFLAEQDPSWEKSIPVNCVRGHECSGAVAVYPCLWLAKIKTKQWVSGGDGEKSRESLNAKNIKPLTERLAATILDSTKTRAFLALHFGIDRLELSIRAAAGQDPAREHQLRDLWADMVDLATPSEFQEFISRRRMASTTSSRNNKIGKLVETLAKRAFEEAGFKVERTGKGSDFRVFVPMGSIEAMDTQEVGLLTLRASLAERNWEFLVEVKATTETTVRMSWEQGRQAGQHRRDYILCVVDFSRDATFVDQILSTDELDPVLIQDLIKLVPDIGDSLAASVSGLENAVSPRQTGIEVERAEELRFCVHQQVWEAGLHFLQWAEAIKSAS